MSPTRLRPQGRPILLCLVALFAASPRSTGQELSRVVPSDAYSYMHMVSDPSMDFVHEANRGVWQAVKEARLHESVLAMLRVNRVPEQDVAQVEGLIGLCTDLVGKVDWDQLVEHEMVYAEIPSVPFPGMEIGISSVLLACRPARENVPALERSLVDLISGVAGITDSLSIQSTETTADPPTRVHSLMAGSQKWMHPVVQVAVRGDTIMAGFGAEAFGRALDNLEGRSDDALVDSTRFQNAVGELPGTSTQFVYFDVEGLLDYIFDQVGPMVIRESGNQWQVRQGFDDLRQLADFVDTSVTSVHAEGNTLVAECWTRYDPIAADAGNPLYEAFCQPAEVSELMDYVPADATSFSITGGVDLRPLHDWALERVQTYGVPDVAEGIILYDGIQAALDISLSDDILSWVGSETVTITMPAQRPLPGGGEDWVMISRLRDAKGAKKVISRLGAVYEVMMPPLLERLEAELGGPAAIPQIEITDAEGGFPGFKRIHVTVSIPGMPIPIPPIDMIAGVIGNQMIVSSSNGAIQRVMDVAAGELDGVWDHPAMASNDRLPQGDVSSLYYIPVGKQLAELTAGLGMVAPMMGVLKQAAGNDPELQRMADFLTDVMPRVTRILNALDFLEDEVTYSQSRNGGLTSYSRTTTRYRDR